MNEHIPRRLLERVLSRTPDVLYDSLNKQLPADRSLRQEKRSTVETKYTRADDPDFLELVARHARGKSTPEEHDFLRSSEVVRLWRDGLKAIRMDVETQSIQRKADAEKFRSECMRKGPSGKEEWFEYKASWDAWKSGAARFKRSIETNLAEAKRLAQENEQHSKQERFRQLLVESLNFLNQEEAITYRYVPDRDALREKISDALYR